MEEAGGDGGDGGGAAGGDGGDPNAGAAAQGALSSENWREFISEDMRGNESLGKFSSLDALAKSYINAETIIGKDKMVIPTTDDEWGSTYDKLGRPETSDQYTLDYGKNADGTKNEGKDQFSADFRTTVHHLGLNNNQVAGIHEWYKGVVAHVENHNQNQSEDDFNKVELELKNDWGEKYNGNLQLAKRMISQFADEDFVDFLGSSKLGNDPRMSKFLIAMSSHLGEDNLELGSGVEAQTNEQLQLEITEVMGTNAYTDRTDPAHDLTVKKVARLHERLYAPAA